LRFLARLAAKSGSGRDIVAAILAGGMWRLRHGSAGERRQMIGALARLSLANFGTTGLAPAIIKAVTRDKFTTGVVSERSSFPLNALLAPGAFPPVGGAGAVFAKPSSAANPTGNSTAIKTSATAHG
jgi:hypothetical protein